MSEDLERINQELLAALEDLQRWAAETASAKCREAIDPMLQGMLKSMGIEMSQFRRQAAVDPYSVLGLDRSASDEEVKKKYRELVHVLHPDKSGTPATGSLFQMVQTAFQLIAKERGWQ